VPFESLLEAAALVGGKPSVGEVAIILDLTWTSDEQVLPSRRQVAQF